MLDWAMDRRILRTYDESLRRCNSRPGFLARFYELFMASSEEVRARFANTDFERQKRALRASLHIMALAAEDPARDPHRYLKDLAVSHGRHGLDIGSRFYDLWLDSLLAAVKEFDPEFSPEVARAWEEVMMVGITYLISHYNDPPAAPASRT
jgi:hemoglobin-like flavoprotein